MILVYKPEVNQLEYSKALCTTPNNNFVKSIKDVKQMV